MATGTSLTTAVGVFENRTQAQKAIDELRRAGFREDQIGVVTRNTEKTDADDTDDGDGNKAGTGALTGAAVGAGVGGLVGLGVIAGVIPVIGPAIAAGTLGVILANAAGGAAIASVVGALVGMDIPEEDASYYEGEFKSGRTLVTVHADGRYDEAHSILQRNGGYNRSSTKKSRSAKRK